MNKISQNIKKLKYFSVLTLISGASFLPAQEEQVISLSEYTVNADRFQTNEEDILGTVSVISSEDLLRTQPKSVYEAVENVPGVFSRNNGGRGSASTLSIRGLSNRQVLVMIDGVRVTNNANISQTNIDLIPIGDVEQIEVLRGPQSVQYGSDAIGGVINIVTKQAQVDGQEASFDIYGGSYETTRLQGTLQGRDGKWDYHVFVSKEETNGISRQSPDDAERDDYENFSLSLQTGYQISERAKVSINYRRSDIQSDFDSIEPTDENAFDQIEQNLFRISGDFELIEDLWTSTPVLSLVNEEVVTTDSFGGSDLQSDVYNFDWQNNLHFEEIVDLVVGFEWEGSKASSGGQFNEDTNTYSFYGLIRKEIGQRVSLQGGFRNDNSDVYDSETTYRFSGDYRILESNTRFVTSYGTSFRAPSLAERFGTFGGFAIPNPSLQAETADGFDIGIEQNLFEERIQLSVVYFYNDITNLLSFEFPNGFSNPGGYENINEVRTQGVEVTADFQIIENLSLALNYTYTETLSRADGGRLARIPEAQVSGNLNYLLLDDALNFNLSGSYIGPRLDRTGGDEAGGYALWDFTARYKVTENLSVYGAIENLLDRDYEDVIGFSTPDRAAYIGLRYTFK